MQEQKRQIMGDGSLLSYIMTPCRIYLGLVMTLLLVASSACKPLDTDGDGVPDDIDVDDDGDGLIEIFDPGMLDNMRNSVDGSSLNGNVTGCPVEPDVCIGYELYNSIGLSGNWNPLGSFSSPFATLLEGNDYTISNLVVSGDSAYLGFFGVLSGTVQNLRFNGGSVSSVANNTTKGRFLGSLAGMINPAGRVLNVSSVSVTITGSSDSNENIGGLVGQNDASSLRDSFSTGAVTAGDGADGRVGGLVGSSVSDIVNSYSLGDVAVGNGGDASVGGLVGVNRVGNITDSYASGDITSGRSNTNNIGGLVGLNEVNNTIRNSYSGRLGRIISGGGAIGGLVGLNNGIIRNTYARSDEINGGAEVDRVGGLVGQNSNNARIINSYATAAAKINGGDGSNDSIGGLIGVNQNIPEAIVNSYYPDPSNVTGGTDNGLGMQVPEQDVISATATTSSNGFLYTDWSENDWNFGSAEQYPALLSFRVGSDGVTREKGRLLCRQPTPRVQCF